MVPSSVDRKSLPSSVADHFRHDMLPGACHVCRTGTRGRVSAEAVWSVTTVSHLENLAAGACRNIRDNEAPVKAPARNVADAEGAGRDGSDVVAVREAHHLLSWPPCRSCQLRRCGSSRDTGQDGVVSGGRAALDERVDVKNCKVPPHSENCKALLHRVDPVRIANELNVARVVRDGVCFRIEAHLWCQNEWREAVSSKAPKKEGAYS